jgi:hypothetical protein
MRKIIFKGTQSERVMYTTYGAAPSLKRALEARGYQAELASDEVDPWSEEDRQSMIAVTGALATKANRHLLFMVDDEEAMDAVWEAVHLYYPDAISDAMQKIARPA